MSEASEEEEQQEILNPAYVENPPAVSIDLPKPLGLSEFNRSAIDPPILNLNTPFDMSVMQKAELERKKKHWKKSANFTSPTRDQLISFDMKNILSIPSPTLYGRR